MGIYNQADEVYVNLLKKIKEEGYDCEPARQNMPGTKAVFAEKLEFNNKAFPILQGKKVAFKIMVAELVWFLQGHTTIQFLLKNKCHIWDGDAYRFYKEKGGSLEKEDWLKLAEEGAYCEEEKCINQGYEVYGYVGNIYPVQWRNLGFDNLKSNLVPRMPIDQIKNLIEGLIKTPYSRYHLVFNFNMQDFKEKNQCLPACHTNFQCNVFKHSDGNFKLDLCWIQRSVDTPLGLPFNIASYALLQRILCLFTGYGIGKLSCLLGNTHYYINQIEYVDEYIKRFENNEIPDKNVQVGIDFENWKWNPKEMNIEEALANIKVEDFHLLNYEPLDKIKAPLNVGL